MEGPIETSQAGLPMNAYTMGYYDGLYGVGPIKGLEGSERYMAGHADGTAVWGGYLRMARGEG